MEEQVSQQDSQLLGCFIPSLTAFIIHSITSQIQSYFAKLSLASCGQAPALSLSCISWSSPSDGSPLMPFLDVGYWWQGKVASLDLWCLSSPACVAPVPDYRGLPEDFPKVSYHLDDITMTFSGTNLILSANPGYQAFH